VQTRQAAQIGAILFNDVLPDLIRFQMRNTRESLDAFQHIYAQVDVCAATTWH
jgi:hypothetical protein